MKKTNDYDVIVIGSGMGGLFAAAKLAKEGKRVLVVEQHSIAGGYVTTFKRRDFTFEACLHAIDTIFSGDEHNPNLDIFRELGILDNINFIRLSEFYKVVHDDFSVIIPDNVAGATSVLTNRFPEESRSITSLMRTLSALRREILLFPSDSRKIIWSLPLIPFKFRRVIRYLFTTPGAVLDRLTNNDELKILLTANTGYYHTDPYKYAMLHYGGAQGSYLNTGCAYIQGGSKKLSDYLVNYIKKNKGEILLKHEVEKIFMERGRVSGIICTGTDFPQKRSISSEFFVANTSIPTVFNTLLPEEAGTKLKRQYGNYSLSHSAFVLYMGLNKNLKTLGNDAYSTFILPSRLRRFKDFSKFTSSTSNLDQKVLTLVDYGQVDSRLTPDGKSVATCTIIDHIDNWEHLDPKAYAERKESVSQEVLTALEKHMPGIRNAVEYYEAATPLTMRRYTLNPDGCIYGYAQINSQIGPRRPDIFSRIPGLYFASAWSKPGGGITPAAKCGYTAACAILEKN